MKNYLYNLSNIFTYPNSQSSQYFTKKVSNSTMPDTISTQHCSILPDALKFLSYGHQHQLHYHHLCWVDFGLVSFLHGNV